jgi:L-lactate utilization protein LutC
VRLVPRSADVLGVFASNAAAAGMVVHRTVAAQVARCVSALAVDLNLRRAAAANDPSLEDAAMGLTAAGVVLEPWTRSRGLDGLYGVDAGLTAVHAAIAETGSLVCGSVPGRGLSLVPPVHLAVVRRSQILPDLVDYLALFSGESPLHRLPSNLVFITGPSKTADIEGVLITGVHGPREVHIVLIEDA